MLSDYLTQTSRLLHDPQNVNFSVSDLTAYINLARGQIASQTQCVRCLDIVDLANGTESYALPTTGTLSGAGQAVAVISIAMPWGTYKPVLDRYSWGDFQAQFRLFSGTVQGFPECYAQLGDALSSAVYFFPIPTQVFASEWYCAHTVSAMSSDADPEAIPYPFTDCVPYFAAYLALINAQRYQESKIMFQTFQMFMQSARSSTNPLFTNTAYPTIPGSIDG